MKQLDIIPFRQLLDRIAVIARRHWRQVVVPIGLPLVAGSGLLTVVQIAWLESLSGVGRQFPLGQLAVLLLIAGLGLLLYVMTFWALAVGAARATRGEAMELWRAWRWIARPRIFGTLAVALIVGLASLLLCLVPALYVLPMLSFVVPVMVHEGRSGLAALHRSRELMSYSPTGHLRHNCWLQILLLSAVGLVVNYALALSFQMPLVVVQQVLAVREVMAGNGAGDFEMMAAGSMWLQLPINLIGAFVTTASWMFWTFGIALLHEETVRRKDAADLVAAIDSMTRRTR